METKYALTYTLYSNNLTDPARSFDSTLTMKDFRRNVWTDIYKAKKVVYVNPKGTSTILKDKNGVK